jgi:hypothetical protein
MRPNCSYSEVEIEDHVVADFFDGTKVRRYDEIPTQRERLQTEYEEFVKRLSKACSQMDEPRYFQIPVANAANVVRERPYCYELYYRLRSIPSPRDLMLVGELDKRGHPIHGDRSHKPDFLVHEPGGHELDLCVVEVKPGLCPRNRYPNKSRNRYPCDFKRQIEKDAETLLYFAYVAKKRYHRGILLFYGDGSAAEPNDAFVHYASAKIGKRPRISIVWHRGPGDGPYRLTSRGWELL